MLKNKILKSGIKWHKTLGWVGGIALLIFATSAIMHPLMTWTGPQSAAFFPPQAKMQSSVVAAIPEILKKNNITKAQMVKVTPGQNGAILQVTENNDSPRRYFDLQSNQELEGYDKDQAVWLARYYTGLKDTEVSSVVFQTEFDDVYPWVNRLLPVYRVTFKGDNSLTAYIYTEINALAGLTNKWKNSLQSVFRFLHTWSWLENFENARIIVMVVFLGCLFGMAATGTAMVFLMKRRKITDGKKRLHRFIAYMVWLPLLAFSASGTYHLLQYSFGDSSRGLKLGNTVDVSPDKFGKSSDWLEAYSDVPLNAISIVEGANGQLLYRLGIPKGKQDEKVTRTQKFDGMATQKTAIYFNALSGKESSVDDKQMAIYYAGKYSDLSADTIINTELVTHFGPDYDFRNKRLPVWRIDYSAVLGDTLFIDPATGILVDRITDKERYESYSFSFLHKWNFLNPITGKSLRDILIVIVLLSSLCLTILGFYMMLEPKQKK